MFLQWSYNELDIVRIKRLAKPATVPPTVSEKSAPGFVENILAGLGFNRVSSEEYLAKLKATREKHLRRIEELERQLAEEAKQNSDINSNNRS